MRAMKDSGIEWLGEIPQDWNIKKLKYLADIRTDKTTDKTESIAYLGLEHVMSNTASLINDYEPILDFEGDTLDFKKGDVLFGKLRPYLAKIYMPDFDGKCSSEFWVMNPCNINGHFLKYAVLSHGFISCINQSTYGVKMPRAEWEYAGNQYIAVPNDEIQTKIAAFLNQKCADIDALIAAKEKTNELLKEQRQSIIFEAVTKGLNPDAPMKDSGVEWIGEIPTTAQISRIKYLGDIFGRIGFRGYTQADIVSEGEGPITLSPSNIDDFGMNYSKCTYLTWEKYFESPEIQVANGDILMVKTGSSYGKSAIIDNLPMEATINPQFIVIKNIKVIPKYLFYYMQTNLFKCQVEQAVVGGTIPTMAQEEINNFYVIIRNDSECKNIVNYLDSKCLAIDTLIEKNNITISKLKEYRQSIIYEAVTGKMEV